MEPYRNLNGNSGVESFTIADDSITIRFRDGPTYVYTYDRPGRSHVERMKTLAREGRGLSAYISQHVGDRFARRTP